MTNCTTVPPTDTARPAASPASDIYETETAWVVLLDVPGIAESDVELTAEGNELRVVARNDTRHYARRFTIGRTVDRDAIAARLRDGVLAVQLPKAASARSRTIPIEAG